MKTAAIGALVSAGLLILALGGFWDSSEAYAQRHAAQAPSSGSELIAFSTTVAGEVQQITIIDPRSRTMCVYHVESDGKIALKSVRQIAWDLQIETLNNTAPLPQEVRSMVSPQH